MVAALAAENEALFNQQQKPKQQYGIPLPPRRMVDPQRSQQIVEAMKRLQRGKVFQLTYNADLQELFELVEFDVTSIELFDNPPLTEYKLYIRNFGNNNTQQAYTQTGEDNANADTQTDDIEKSNKAVQFPVDFASSLEESQLLPLDTQRLMKFLDKAAQVCEDLLEQNMTDTSQKKATFTSPYPFSVQFINIPAPKFMETRPVVGIFDQTTFDFICYQFFLLTSLIIKILISLHHCHIYF